MNFPCIVDSFAVLIHIIFFDIAEVYITAVNGVNDGNYATAVNDAIDINEATLANNGIAVNGYTMVNRCYLVWLLYFVLEFSICIGFTNGN